MSQALAIVYRCIANNWGNINQHFLLIEPDKNAGITITESFAMLPTAAVSGFYFSHPDAKYFGTGKIQKDQVEDYAKRKGENLSVVERWLAPVLDYDV